MNRKLDFSNGPVFGAWTQFGHPSITEIFAASGVNFIGIDLEHSTISLEQAQRIIAASQAGGALCLPRISSHNREQLSRLLDSGADGVIVPNVSEANEVTRIIEWMKYPPAGKRGYGVARAHRYGLNFDEYVSTWNERSTLILQIESIKGAESADSLVSQTGVDGAMIGPYDISGSVGVPGRLDHPRVKAACRSVIDACKRHGKACGTQIVDPNSANVAAAVEEGYDFVILGADVFLLWKWSERMRAVIKAVKEQEAPHAVR